MTRSALDELAARCEATEGPDRELDWQIAVASGQYISDTLRRGKMLAEAANPKLFSYGWPEYTASLDAALTLVLEGWDWVVDSIGMAECWRSNPDDVTAHAATPALALCAAALKARAHGDGV